MSTQTDLKVCTSSSWNDRRDIHRAAIALNEIGIKLYVNGQHDAAIAMFDAAAQAVMSQKTPCPLLIQHLRWGSLIMKEQVQQNSEFQLHPPDTYLEGACDVGPRPFRAPLHLDASSSSCSEVNEFVLEAMVFFNKALVHHSKSELDKAMIHYTTALEKLSKNSHAGHASPTVSRVSYLVMMIHNNMGQICYIKEAENALQHLETAVFWANHIHVGLENEEFIMIFATVLSNYCRSKWINCNIDEDTYRAFQTVLQLRLVALPADHIDVACAHYNMGILQFARDNFDSAKTHLQEYLDIATKKTTGDSALDPIPAITLLLIIENDGKDDKQSLELIEALYLLQEKREEVDSAQLEVATLLNYIGTLLFYRKELHAALLFYRDELRIEKVLMKTEGGMNISVTYHNMGRILLELGELSEAIECYRNALHTNFDDTSYEYAAAFAAGTVDFSIPGGVPASPATTHLFSTIWYNLGLIHDKMGGRREAIMSFQMALGLRRKMLGFDHPDVACLWYNIGILQMENNNLKEALASFQESLRIRRFGQQSNDDPRHILTSLEKLACLQQNQGNISDALATLNEILQIQESHAFDMLWNKPGAVGLTLRTIADLQEAKGDLTAALASAKLSYLAFKASADAYVNTQNGGTLDHLEAVEEAVKSLLVLGGIYNEACEPVLAQDTHEDALHFISTAIYHTGGVSNASSSSSSLHPLLDVCTLQLCSNGAPVA